MTDMIKGEEENPSGSGGFSFREGQAEDHKMPALPKKKDLRIHVTTEDD
jgi:hypothetical protein